MTAILAAMNTKTKQPLVPKVWTTKELAAEVGVSVDRLRYAIHRGYLAKPKRRDATTFTWAWRDVCRAKEWFRRHQGVCRVAQRHAGEKEVI